MKPRAVPAGRLEQRVGADEVGLDEGSRVVERVVVVALGGIVHDCVRLGGEPVDEGRIRDVPVHEGEAVVRKAVERGPVARVGELVEHGHVVVGVLDHVVHEVGADEPGAAGDQKIHAM